MPSLVGHTISHYEILEQIGGGGMGMVYKARDRRLDRLVALKFLPPGLTSDPQARERFTNEARAASSLQHSNICVVYDIDEAAGGETFICMEFLEGATLAKRLEDRRTMRGGLPVSEALGITLQVAHGLSAAHAHGIIHRDIKPANIILTANGVAKIVDFGIAKLGAQPSLTRTGTMLGTAAYMSPEQARGEEVDRRSDIWSLGVLLYELLSGCLPFRGEFEQGVIYSILNEQPRPLTECNRGLPAGLDAIVSKALAKQPSDRYTTVQEFIDDLAAIGTADPTPNRHPSLLRRPAARKAIVAGALILVALGGAWIFLFPGGSDGTTPVASRQPSSIAVLPFTDLSPGKDQEYFCSGIAEELSSALTQLPELRVVSRTRAFALSKDAVDLRGLGEQLGVATLLDGSVRKDDRRLRITAQLIDGEDGSQIWTDTYDRTLQDVFTIQKEVARSVAAALQITLAPQTTEAMMPHQSANVEAFEHWLRGSYFVKLYLISNKEQDILSAISRYETAIALDSLYALAYGGLAWAYEHKFLLGNRQNPADREQTVSCILKAYQLDQLSGGLNAGMGYLALANRNLDTAYHFFKTALALEPRSYLVNFLAGEFLTAIGLCDCAEAFFTRSIAGDPYYLLTFGEAAGAYEMQGKFEKAAAYYERALRLSPNDPLYRTGYIDCLIKSSRLDKAEELLKETAALSPDFIALKSRRSMVLAARGEKHDALRLARLPEVYALLGMRNEALTALKAKAGTSAAYEYQSVATNTLFSTLRSDARFQAILSQLEATYRERKRKYGDLGKSLDQL